MLNRARELSPAFTGAVANLGALYLHQGKYDQAIHTLGRALAIEPDNVDAHWNRSLAYLSIGNLEQGWVKYEWRWLRPGKTRKRVVPRPQWDGASLNSSRLLLHSEQGLGDTIQFVREKSKGSRNLRGQRNLRGEKSKRSGLLDEFGNAKRE